MNRRRFIAGTSAIAVGAALGELSPHAALGAGCDAFPAGVQLFTVRNLLQHDPAAALAALHDIGIVEAELYGLSGMAASTLLGKPLAELRSLFRSNDIDVPISHIDGDLTHTAEIAAMAQTLGIGTLVVALPREFRGVRDGRPTRVPAESRAQLDQLAERLNRTGREYQAHGLAFGYHNHNVEFVPVEGVVPFDYLVSRTDPELVKLELDLGWLASAGIDPAAYIRQHAGRVIACHMKDFDPAIVSDVLERKLVEPGAGTIDYAAVLAAMRDTKVAHAFIEIDVSDDPLAAVSRGRNYLQRLQACA